MVVVIATVLFSILSSALVKGQALPILIPLSQSSQAFGCQCSDFMWRRPNGVIVGRCLSRDIDGLPICYLHQPNSCRDAVTSAQFCTMQVTKIGCGCNLDARGFCLPPGSSGLFGGLSSLLSGDPRLGLSGEGLDKVGGQQEAGGKLDDGKKVNNTNNETLPFSVDDHGFEIF